MKSDGPLILALLFIAAGLTVIFSYGTGTTGLTAGYPLSAAHLEMSITTSGPAVVGGLSLVLLGLLAMVWAVLCAVVGLFRYHASDESRLERLEAQRLKQEEKLERERLRHQERMLKHDERMGTSLFPRA